MACEFCKLNGVSCIDYVDAQHCPNTYVHRRFKIPERKKVDANELAKRTRLTAKQLKRLKEEGGKGEHLKYSAKGEVSLELIRRLAIAKRNAERYVLYTDEIGRRLYVADREFVKQGAQLTFNIKEALHFLNGFDEPEIKINYFNKTLNLNFNKEKIYGIRTNKKPETLL